jgi:hypothetical protein
MLGSVFTGLLVISAAIVLAVASQRRFLAGYPAPPSGLAVLHRGEAAFLQSAAEVLFPEGASLPVVGVDAHLPLYVDRHLAALPGTQRLQIRALLLLFEHLSLVFPAGEPGGRDRFSSLPVAARLAVLERVAAHRDDRVRLLFTALRAIVALGYLGHPANLRALSLAPFEIEPAVSDAELLFPRVGALPLSIRHVEADRTNPEALGPLDPHGPCHRAYQRSSRDSR